MKSHENKKKYPIPITNHAMGKMHAMRSSKDLYSTLGGIGKGSEGQTQLQYF